MQRNRQQKKNDVLQAIRNGTHQGSALEQIKLLFDQGIDPTQELQLVKHKTLGLTKKDLKTLRDKIRTAKKDITRRSKSETKLEIVKSWYDFFFDEFKGEFDNRSKASFGKVGQTQYTQSQAGSGQGQQINYDSILINEEVKLVAQQKLSQIEPAPDDIQKKGWITESFGSVGSAAPTKFTKNPDDLNTIIKTISEFDGTHPSLENVLNEISDIHCFKTFEHWKYGS